MGSRGGGDLADHAAQALLDQLAQGPARAVARQHGQVVQVDRGGTVGFRDFLIIDLAEPVVGRDRAGIGQNEPADGIGDGGVFLDAPVVDLQIVVHQILVVQQGAADVADLFVLLAVQDVGLGDVIVPRLGQHLLHGILNILNGDQPIFDLIRKVCGDAQRQQIQHVLCIFLFLGKEGLFHGRADFADFKRDSFPVPLFDLIHVLSSINFGPARPGS